jgi:hypothetical protein
MKLLKKHIFLLTALLAILSLLLTSCTIENKVLGVFQTGRTKLLDVLTGKESVKIKQMSNDIIKCFTEKDKEALKGLFCEQVRNKSGFDDELDKAFEYLNCDVYTTSTIDDTASGGMSTEHGEYIKWYVAPEIPYFSILKKIESDTDPGGYEHVRCYYSISYYWQITYKEDASLEGLHYMVIELLNVDRLIIGDKTSITNYNPYGYFKG